MMRESKAQESKAQGKHMMRESKALQENVKHMMRGSEAQGPFPIHFTTRPSPIHSQAEVQSEHHAAMLKVHAH